MQTMQSLCIGVLADTHIPHRLDRLPVTVGRIFAGVDFILHAGDLDEVSVLAELGHIAPAVAVRGNWHLHPPNRSSPHLPETVHLYLLDQHIVLTHGLSSLGYGLILEFYARVLGQHARLNELMIRNLHRRFRHADVVIFGHPHHAEIRRIERTLFINPGAVCSTPDFDERPAVALLTVHTSGAEAEIVYLDEEIPNAFENVKHCTQHATRSTCSAKPNYPWQRREAG